MKLKDKALQSILNQSGCLTPEAMVAFVTGQCDTQTKSHIERHLSTCELCRDAVDGLKLHPKPQQWLEEIDRLNRKITRKAGIQEDSNIRFIKPVLAVAASLVLLAGVVFGLKHLLNTEKSAKQDVASVEKPMIPPIDELDQFGEESTLEMQPVDSNGTYASGNDSVMMVADLNIPRHEASGQLQSRSVATQTDQNREEQVLTSVNEDADEHARQPDTGNAIYSTETTRTAESMKMPLAGVATDKTEMPSTTPQSDNETRSRSAITSSVSTDHENKQEQSKPVSTNTSAKARFPGGEQALQRYFREHLTYPGGNKPETPVQVKVRFTVNESGEISRVKATGDAPNSYKKTAEKLVKGMPPWMPAQEDGKPIKSEVELTVEFK